MFYAQSTITFTVISGQVINWFRDIWFRDIVFVDLSLSFFSIMLIIIVNPVISREIFSFLFKLVYTLI